MTEKEIQARFLEPFEPHEVKWRAGATSNNKAMALAYIDARAVMDRLDDVVGMYNWRCTHQRLSNDQVACKLAVRINGEWIEKEDVGSESQQPSEGDKTKAAFSDSLKRAAVLFGIGRYLYRLPQQWVGYDPQRKRLTETPKLPEWALPKGVAPGATQPTQSAPPPLAEPAPASKTAGQPSNPPAIPQNGFEFWDLIRRREEELVKRKLCKPGELIAEIEKDTQDYPSDLIAWSMPQIERAYGLAKALHRQFVGRQAHANAA
jgi:hypothetical protein